jgi:CBS domain-containing protein
MKRSKERPKRARDWAGSEPKPLQQENSVKEAGEKMRSLETSNYPVASGQQLVGLVESADPDRKAAGYGHDPETTLVRDSMIKKVIYCFEDQPVEDALATMRENQVKHLPVVDHQLRVIGMVSIDELDPASAAPGTAPEDARGEGRGRPSR